MNFIRQSDHADLSGVDADILRCKLKNIENIDTAVETVTSLSVLHTDYNILAARIKLEQLYKASVPSFSECMVHFKDQLSPKFQSDVSHLAEENLDREIRHERDNLFSYAALETLESMFLMNDGRRITERPQHMYMRLAVQLHGRDLSKVLETYTLLSEHWYTHATPTLINAGKKVPQLSSCFLVDSPTVENFFEYMEKCRRIFRDIGGVGVAFHKIPSEYFVPCVRILDNALKLNSNARNSSCAVFIEPWHSSIYDFLSLKTNTGDPEMKARNLFYGLWVNDLFMQRVEEDKMWSLFCPAKCPGLESVYGQDFEKLYVRYESAGGHQRVRARDLFKRIITCQIETGTPYFLYKDVSNRNSPYSGTIQCSNLCAEIIEFASEAEVAVCTLASLSLPKFVVMDGGKFFDFERLARVTRKIVENLDRVISAEALPVKECRDYNDTHRPLGIGIQGLSDVFQMLRFPFESPEARELNAKIAETIYKAANVKSWEMGDGVSRRHILLCAYMPTATTALILGNTESFEARTSNMYIRRLKWGNFYIINERLVRDLVELDMWNEGTRDQLIRDYGSVRNIENFPYKDLYKTVWEIPQRTLVDMAIDRSPFVDQSQSLNIFIADPTVAQISALHFYTWRSGRLKTGMYYLRTKPACQPIQYSLCCTA